MSKAVVNTFKKMDTDTSQNKQDNSSFYDAQDLRLISDEPLSNGALVNYKGTKAKIDLGDNTNKVVGYAEVGSELVLLCYNTTYNYIASVSLSEGSTLQPIVILYRTTNNGLGFNGLTSVETIGRYENEYSKKIYFAVPNQPLRVFNIYSPNGSTVNESAVSTLDILPNNSGSILSLEDGCIIQGGKLESGKIQYACKLFNKYGTETTFSTCSELISLTSDNYNGANEFKGSDLESNSGKSVRVNISLLNTDFKYIHIYSIHYKVKDTPVISLVGEIAVPTNYSAFSFIDNGTILDSITLEEFNIFGGNLISAETIGTKNNILFAANTKEISDTISLDCRAYRFSENQIIYELTEVDLFEFNTNYVIFSTDIEIDGLRWIKMSLYEATPQYYKIISIVEPESGGFEYKLDTTGMGVVENLSNRSFISEDSYYQSYIYETLSNDPYIIASNGYWSRYIPYLSVTYGVDFDLPLTADCINKYNDEFLKASASSIHPHQYDKKIDGITYGGTGKIVSYEIKLDATATKLMDGGETIIDSSNIDFILKETSFKQGETYRCALVAYDLKGKPYFANWIGDIRIPYFDDTIVSAKSGAISAINIDTNVKNISIEFSVDTDAINTYHPNTLSKISGFQIVKVQRTSSDKSVVAQGCSMGGVVFNGNLAHNRCLPIRWFDYDFNELEETPTDAIHTIHTFYSPEFNINGGLDIGGNYRLNVVKILSNPIFKYNAYPYYGLASLSGPRYSINYASVIFYPINRNNSTTTELSSLAGTNIAPGFSFNINNIFKTSITENNGNRLIVSNENYINRVAGNTVLGQTMFGQTSVIMDSTTYLNKFIVDDDIGFTYILDLYIDNANTRYGGNTYSDRILNEYEACSSFIKKTTGVHVLSARGDSYNTIWDTLTAAGDPSVDDGTTGYSGAGVDRKQVVALLPLESSINCMLTGSKPSKYVFKYYSGANITEINAGNDPIGLCETELQGINIYGSKYPKIGDFNSYNTTYSSTSKYPTFFPEPFLFTESTSQPNLIQASEKKINGEYVDSWSKFLYANSLEVDGVYGDIHKLTTLDNKLYFFQESAIGIAAVNDRYIIGQGDASKLSLGAGGVLERYDYVKYNEGIIKPSHVINTISNLYFIDHNRKVLDIVGSSDIALSIEKGINTLFRKLYKDPTTLVTIGFDPVYREVLFNINNNTLNQTLVYNENINQFQPRSSALPQLFLNISDGLLSFKQSLLSPTGIKNYIYKHNAGDIGELYSEANSVAGTKVYSDSYISILVGSQSTGVFVADNVEFRTEVRPFNDTYSIFNDVATYSAIVDSDLKSGAYGDVLKTFDHVEFKNSYQRIEDMPIIAKQDSRTNTIPFTAATYPNTSRRHRSWTMQVPMFKDVTTGNNTRFIDTFLSMKFTYHNNNKVFKLHDITTYIRPTHK